MAGVAFDALDHGAHAIGALRRQMRCQPQSLEQGHRVRIENFARRLSRIEAEDEMDETAHYMGVAIAEKPQPRAFPGADDLRFQPDLTRAATHLVRFVMRRFGQGFEVAPQLDQIAVAVFPVVEKFEIADDRLEGHGVLSRGRTPLQHVRSRLAELHSADRAPEPMSSFRLPPADCHQGMACDLLTDQQATGAADVRRKSISFIFRGVQVDVADTPPHTTLLDWLRLSMRATGTKEGCAEGDCGACTVVLARPGVGGLVHRPVNACILLLGQADGAEIITVEDLASSGALHPVQAAMVEKHGSQCGFCTPGIVMSLFALYQRGHRAATRVDVCDQLAGNLCRCTGYRPIVDAALEVCEGPPDDRFSAATPQRLAALAALQSSQDVLVGEQSADFFAAPASEESLAALYARHPGARIVAGATDAGLSITKGLQTPAKIIWLGRVKELETIERSTTHLSLGAGVLLADAVEALAAIHPDLGEIMRRFGSAQVRASGTVGGNIANASPIGDLAPCLIALGAALELSSVDGARTLLLEDFFIAYGKQDRRAGEYVRGVRIPLPGPQSAFRAFKISKRSDEDISAVLAAFHFILDGRRIVSARIAFGGMAGTPARARHAEAACAGIDLDAVGAGDAAIAALATDFSPIDDMRASAAYRRLVAGNLLRKALIEIAGAAEPTRVKELVHAAR